MEAVAALMEDTCLWLAVYNVIRPVRLVQLVGEIPAWAVILALGGFNQGALVRRAITHAEHVLEEALTSAWAALMSGITSIQGPA